MASDDSDGKFKEYIYLLREREFIRHNECVYKIGRTKQDHNKRFLGYPKGSELILQMKCDDCRKAEGDLKKIFDKKFTHTPDYGREYYEGDEKEMLNTIIQYINEKCFNNYIRYTGKKKGSTPQKLAPQSLTSQPSTISDPQPSISSTSNGSSSLNSSNHQPISLKSFASQSAISSQSTISSSQTIISSQSTISSSSQSSIPNKISKPPALRLKPITPIILAQHQPLLNTTLINSLEKYEELKKIINDSNISLVKLEQLDISEYQLDNLLDIPKFIYLIDLKLNHNNLTSIEIIPILSKLQQLDLRCNQITTLNKMSDYMQLTKLDLSRNKLTSVTGMGQLPVLEYLDLNNNQLATLVGIQKLPRLKIFSLNENELTMLLGMPSFPQLIELNINGNKLITLRELPELPELEQLDLDNNQLMTINDGYELKLPKLKELGLVDNPISETEKQKIKDKYSFVKFESQEENQFW